MKIKEENVHQYTRHIQNLATLAGVEEHEARNIYKSLCRLENRANRLTTRECNEGNFNGSRQLEAIKEKVLKLIPNLPGFFINGDPRGYSLKIKEDQAKELQNRGINIYTDWGGYGILAPEL